MVCRVTNNLEESNTADFNKRTMGTIFQTNTKHRPSPAKGHARSPGARARRPPPPTPACGARGPGAQRSAPPTSASSGGEAEPPRAATCLALRRRACAAGHRALPALAQPPQPPPLETCVARSLLRQLRPGANERSGADHVRRRSLAARAQRRAKGSRSRPAARPPAAQSSRVAGTGCYGGELNRKT